ncbi:MAG: hypothetical protein HUU01_07310 [Saprospiraceae bacterium]|nr:hypothetical protein [Saprospiraceae bacterium]
MQKAVVQTRFFRFGGMLHQHDQHLAFQLVELEDQLNRAISAPGFAAVVESVYFIPVIVPEEQVMEHQEVLSYKEAEKKITIQKRVSASTDLMPAFLEALASLSADHPQLLPLFQWVKQQVRF